MGGGVKGELIQRRPCKLPLQSSLPRGTATIFLKFSFKILQIQALEIHSSFPVSKHLHLCLTAGFVEVEIMDNNRVKIYCFCRGISYQFSKVWRGRKVSVTVFVLPVLPV